MRQSNLHEYQYSGEHPWRDENVLRELYVEQQLTQQSIADRFDCSRATIGKWLARHGIETRTPTESRNAGAPWRDETTLREMYVERQMTAAEIGDELGCSKGAVLDQLDRNGIEARGFGEQPKWIDAPWRDESMLRELYVDEGLPMETIAARLDCSSTAVRLGLIRHGIDRRTHAETTIGQLPDALTDAERMHEWYVTERMTGPEIADRLDKPLTTVLRWLERHEIDRRGHDARIADELQDEELMHRLYVGERLSLNKIGERYGHADSTVRRWLQIHEIDTSTGLIQSGQDNPNWRGGSSVLEAVRTLIGDLSWNSISQRTRAAASDECEMCGDTPAKRGCDVHHIVPIMAGGDNGDYNLMVLCRRCHATVEHYTREYFDPVLVE